MFLWTELWCYHFSRPRCQAVSVAGQRKHSHTNPWALASPFGCALTEKNGSTAPHLVLSYAEAGSYPFMSSLSNHEWGAGRFLWNKHRGARNDITRLQVQKSAKGSPFSTQCIMRLWNSLPADVTEARRTHTDNAGEVWGELWGRNDLKHHSPASIRKGTRLDQRCV